jgi:hypothetical protein
MLRKQAANRVLMVRPAAFGFNADTAGSNALQRPALADEATTQASACEEFAALAEALLLAGVGVCVVQDTPQPPKPDALFPNNWVSFHQDGTVVLYPMQAASRRVERRREIVDEVSRQLGFRVQRLLDLTQHEQRGEFLEGTGSLVLDHVRRTAYACRSPRTSEVLVERWCSLMGFEPVIFDATDASGRPYYHTNVVLSIGLSHAVVGLEAIAERDRTTVMKSLQHAGCEVIAVDRNAVGHFSCNILQLTGKDSAGESESVLVMSETARQGLGDAQLKRLTAKLGAVVVVPIPTIERVGGGSVRCMLAEVFIPS